jgi:hypothetical protein
MALETYPVGVILHVESTSLLLVRHPIPWVGINNIIQLGLGEAICEQARREQASN